MLAIRAATAADVQAIARVHVDTWRTTYRGIVPDDFLGRLSYERRAAMWSGVFAKPIATEHLLVATTTKATATTAAGEVVGFASGGANRDETLPFDGELYAIYLTAEFQGQGFGSRLFDASVAALRSSGFRGMVLWALAGNAACTFYERKGGQCVGSKMEQIGGKSLAEVAYGWEPLPVVKGA